MNRFQIERKGFSTLFTNSLQNVDDKLNLNKFLFFKLLIEMFDDKHFFVIDYAGAVEPFSDLICF